MIYRYFIALFCAFSLGMAFVSCRQASNEPNPVVADSVSIQKFEFKTYIHFVNADHSRLPLYYRIFNANSKQWEDYSGKDVKFYADGVLQSDNRYYTASKEGLVSLTASLYGITSAAPVKITARLPKTYPLVNLPVIFHLAKNADLSKANTSLEKVMEEVNKLYRNQKGASDPNAADSFIEFHLAPNAPDGKPLAQKGLNRLNFDDPLTDTLAAVKADSVLRKWCVKNYINIFVGIRWIRREEQPGFSYSYFDALGPGRFVKNSLANEPFRCLGYESSYSGPAIIIHDVSSLMGAVAHELGHYLGLDHAFIADCSYPVAIGISDIPKFVKQGPNNGIKFTCTEVPFVSTNVMDYYVTHLNFTQDQAAYMRKKIAELTYLPL
jgi:hypothetical protein